MFQKVKQKATLAATAVALSVMTLPVYAADSGVDLSSIGTEMAKAIAQFVVIISSMGMAGISVVVMASAFKMAFSFIKTLK